METTIRKKKDYKTPRKVKNGISVQVNLMDVVNASESGLTITGITTSSQIRYYSIPAFINKYCISYSTIARNIQKFKHHRDNHNYFLKLGERNFVSCGIIGHRKSRTKKFTNDDYAQWLRCFDWNIKGTVRYAEKYPLLTIRKTMERLFQKIRQKYYDKPLIFFFATEPNPDGLGGYHSHFILGFQDELNFRDIKRFINDIVKPNKVGNAANTEIEVYIPDQNYIEYLVKQINLCPDGYDFFSNHLQS